MNELSQIRANPQRFFRILRWHGVVACPECGSCRVYSGKRGYICGDCDNRFTDTSGTIFHSTKLSLRVWLEALYYMLRSSRGISSYNLAKYIGVTQPTAWRMMHRLRAILPQNLPEGEVCIDEVYIGAEWKWIPSWKKIKLAQSYKDPRLVVWGPKGYHEPTLKEKRYALANSLKRPVLGIIEYKSRKLWLGPLPSPATRSSVKSAVLAHSRGLTHMITDQSSLYNELEEVVPRSVCNHALEQYVSSDGFSSNKIENVFTNLRRSLRGVYGWWSTKYQQLYLNEFAFRFQHPRASFPEICDIIAIAASG